jgi:hypothetical protein
MGTVEALTTAQSTFYYRDAVYRSETAELRKDDPIAAVVRLGVDHRSIFWRVVEN